MFKSVLIANRGEIACRVARTAKRLGMRVIAIYSEADAQALHVRLADEAYCIGPAPARESYLVGERLLDVAKKTGAECLHPGYGFLSENASFAEECERSGIVFVGPKASSIRAMGLKDQAKELMARAGVPVVPGYHGDHQEPSFLKEQADKIGYPILIKAVSGGGGKGMRRVDSASDFLEALASCCGEALSSFGDQRVLLERYVLSPRHIEVQVFCDRFGAGVYLFERDCSLQRRHQKVIEEAPAPQMSQALREKMGEAALMAAQAVGYEGAGTVEFIVDSSSGLREDGFFFMEMNTRLQVEHPVTEAITGLDLVEWQFKVAAGEPLPLKQQEIKLSGHAVEARLYAEDPSVGFLPQTGVLRRLLWPVTEHRAVRLDTGVEEGAFVSPFYDPMIAKVIAHGATRRQAIMALFRFLQDTVVLGVRSNLAFLKALLQHPDFLEERLETGFIDRNLNSLLPPSPPFSLWLAGLEAWIFFRLSEQSHRVWGHIPGWTLSGEPRRDHLYVLLNGEEICAFVSWVSEKERHYEIPFSGKIFKFIVLEKSFSQERVRFTVSALNEAGEILEPEDVTASFVIADQSLYVASPLGHVAVVSQALTDRKDGEALVGNDIKSPMPGRVARVLVGEGQEVLKGECLLVLEAMKMEHPLRAAFDGAVQDVFVSEGEQVEDGQVLVVLKKSAPIKGE